MVLGYFRSFWVVLGCFSSFLTFFSTIFFFFYRHCYFTGQQGKGWDHLLFISTTSTRSQTLRYLFATLHVKRLSRIFNHNGCVYQTATRLDLPLLVSTNIKHVFQTDCKTDKVSILNKIR